VNKLAEIAQKRRLLMKMLSFRRFQVAASIHFSLGRDRSYIVEGKKKMVEDEENP
jgi:hypothetical protein